MAKVLHNKIFLVLSACVGIGMASLVEAWTLRPTINPRSASLAIHYRNGSVNDQQSIEHRATTAISNKDTTSNEQGTNVALQIALTAARDADRLHGLCSPGSIKAWAVVDDIFLSSSASREVESHVRRVLGHEKSIWDL